VEIEHEPVDTAKWVLGAVERLLGQGLRFDHAKILSPNILPLFPTTRTTMANKTSANTKVGPNLRRPFEFLSNTLLSFTPGDGAFSLPELFGVYLKSLFKFVKNC
jgi:hypothetical protein